jgi:hypothetical protein
MNFFPVTDVDDKRKEDESIKTFFSGLCKSLCQDPGRSIAERDPSSPVIASKISYKAAKRG